MGKTLKWFRSLFSSKKPETRNPKPRKWTFGRKSTNAGGIRSGADDEDHAVAVAVATAAVVEAAVAAANAAAAVVKMTSGGGGGGRRREVCAAAAAVKIQAYFRAYLARRALRALRALVKLQALVRGHIVRKQTADMMRRMQALLRAQARARAGRSESPQSSTKFHHRGPPTPEKLENIKRVKSKRRDQSLVIKRNGSKYGPTDDEKNDKILEIDTVKPHVTPRRKTLFPDQNSHSHSYSQSFTTSRGSTIQQACHSLSSGEVNSASLSPLKLAREMEEMVFCTAENSPQFYSASSKGNSSTRGPFTPSKSDGSRSCLSGYSDHPNYMAYTESSRAKVRSLSAPRQRPQFEVSSNTKRQSGYGYGDFRSGRVSAVHTSFASKAYPGSGRLDRLGMPVGGGDVGRFSSGHWNRW